MWRRVAARECSCPARVGQRVTDQGGVRPSGSSTVLIPILVAQTVKNLPAIQEMQVQSLGQEDSLEEGTATHSSILV